MLPFFLSALKRHFVGRSVKDRSKTQSKEYHEEIALQKWTRHPKLKNWKKGNILKLMRLQDRL